MSDQRKRYTEDDDNSSPKAAADTIRVTGFADKFSQVHHELEYTSLGEIAEQIQTLDKTTKGELPWIKLAQVSGEPSENGSLRYDDAITELWGAEGDYDGERVPIQEAADKLGAAGIEALLYETASSTPERPRWRVLCWASQGYGGGTNELRELRARWVARINGVLDGILAGESFTLSQSYYVGGITGQPPIQVAITEGTRIDLRDDLDAGAIFKNGKAKAAGYRTRTSPEGRDRDPCNSACESNDDPRLLRECESRVEGFRRRWGIGTTPAGERAHKLVQWLGDVGTRDGLTPSAQMMEQVIQLDYPETTVAIITNMLSRRQNPRGSDVIDAAELKTPEPETPKQSAQPEEAIAAIRELAQEWLSRSSKHDPTLTIVTAPAGLGKSTTMDAEQLKAEQRDQIAVARLNEGHGTVGDLSVPALGKMAVAVPRHLLAEELQGLNRLEREAAGFPKNPILHGRNATNCQRFGLVTKAQQHGFSPSALCRRNLPGGEVQTCPFFDRCTYQENQKEVKAAPNIIIQHAHLAIPWMDSLGLANRKRLWIDEDPSNIFLVDERITDEQLGDLVNDVEIAELAGSGLAGLASLSRLSKDLQAGLSASSGLCARHLDGWTPLMLRRAAKARQVVEDYRRGKLNPSLDEATILTQIERTKAPVPLVTMILRLADEIAARRKGEIYSLYRDPQTRQIRMRGRVPTDMLPPNLLITDATASPKILSAVFPSYRQELVEIPVRRNAHITQTNSHVFSRKWLLQEGHLSEVIEWIEQLTSRYGNLVVLTTKSIRRAITGEAPGKLPEFAEFHGARLGHYGNIRGSDKYKDCDALVILGRQQPMPEEIEKIAKAFWYDTPKALKLCKVVNGKTFYEKASRPYLMREGSSVASAAGAVQLHRDPRCQAVLAGLRENELIQAIDRARLIWGEPKDVFILCDIPLPGVEIDRLVSWDVLRGADRLSRAITAARARGEKALPLSPSCLLATYPKLFVTENAAKMWLKKSPEIKELKEKGPLSNIKTMGPETLLLFEYRLPRTQGGAGQWSTALVWGSSPQGAIAHALGVPDMAVKLRPRPRPWRKPMILKKPCPPVEVRSCPWVTPLSFAAMLRPDEGTSHELSLTLAILDDPEPPIPPAPQKGLA